MRTPKQVSPRAPGRILSGPQTGLKAPTSRVAYPPACEWEPNPAAYDGWWRVLAHTPGNIVHIGKVPPGFATTPGEAAAWCWAHKLSRLRWPLELLSAHPYLGVEPSMRGTFAVPPSGNDYWKNAGRGRRVRTQLAVDYVHATRTRAIIAKWKPIPAGPAVGVITHWFAAGQGDTDNRQKILLDALQGVGYDNDRQVAELHAYRWNTFPGEPRVEVHVWAL